MTGRREKTGKKHSLIPKVSHLDKNLPEKQIKFPTTLFKPSWNSLPKRRNIFGRLITDFYATWCLTQRTSPYDTWDGMDEELSLFFFFSLSLSLSLSLRHFIKHWSIHNIYVPLKWSKRKIVTLERRFSSDVTGIEFWILLADASLVISNTQGIICKWYYYVHLYSRNEQ